MSLIDASISYRNNKDLVCTKCKEEDPSVESDTSELLTLDQVSQHF